MKPFNQELYERLRVKYDALITELETQNQENRDNISKANQHPDDPDTREWARLARENLRRL